MRKCLKLVIKDEIGALVVMLNEFQLRGATRLLIEFVPRSLLVDPINREWGVQKADQCVTRDTNVHAPIIGGAAIQKIRYRFQSSNSIHAGGEIADQIVINQMASVDVAKF